MSRMQRRVAQRRREAFDVQAAVEQALAGPERARVVGGRAAPGDAKALRGLPVVGGPLGGAIPGTRPGVHGKLGRWSGR